VLKIEYILKNTPVKLHIKFSYHMIVEQQNPREASAMLTGREQVQYRLIAILLCSYDAAGESLGRSRRDILLSATWEMLRLPVERDDAKTLADDIRGSSAWAVLDNAVKIAAELGPTPKQRGLWRWQDLGLETIPDRWLASELAWHHHRVYLEDMARHCSPLNRFRSIEREAALRIWQLAPVNIPLPHSWEELVTEVNSRRLDSSIRQMELEDRRP
jgi:hypothetical protein